MRYLTSLMLAGLLFTGCQPRILSVQTEYLSHINLASYHVGTPDPRLRNPPLGQKLIVNWSLPTWDCNTAYELTVKIRFKNGTSAHESFPLANPKGTFVFPLLNEDYFTKGGFKTYVAIMSADGIQLEEWRHQLWVNIIEISENEGYEHEDDDENDDDEPIEWDREELETTSPNTEAESETDQQIYDEHYKGEGAIQRPIEDVTDPNQTQYKYYF